MRPKNPRPRVTVSVAQSSLNFAPFPGIGGAFICIYKTTSLLKVNSIAIAYEFFPFLLNELFLIFLWIIILNNPKATRPGCWS